MSLPNKLIGCGEEICGLAAPLTEGMKGHKNKQRGRCEHDLPTLAWQQSMSEGR